MNHNAKNKFNGRHGRFGSDGPRRNAPEPDLCILRADGRYGYKICIDICRKNMVSLASILRPR